MSIWLILLFVVVEVICLILTLYFSRKFYKNKDYYPIKQLSPLITMIQGFSFFICQLTLFAMIIFFYDKNIEIKDSQEGDQGKKLECVIQANSKDEYPEHVTTYKFISFMYILSRGFCYAFTVAKSYRVLVGFQRNRIQYNSFQLLIFKQEIYLIIFAILYAVLGFPVLVILTTNYYNFESFCWLQVYETNFGGVKYNSWIEELIMLSVILLVNPRRRNDKLVTLTINLQVIYVFWFAINSLISKYSPLPVQISCWVRSIVMFYGYIYIPWKLKEQNPTLYITTQQISNFEIIISKKFNAFYTYGNYCLEQFKNFIKYLDNTNETIKLENGIAINTMTNFEFFDLFEKVEELIEKGGQNDNLTILLSKNEEIDKIFMGQDHMKIKETMFSYLKYLYESKLKKTKAYVHLYQFYDSNLTIQHNFELLNMQLKEVHLPNFNINIEG